MVISGCYDDNLHLGMREETHLHYTRLHYKSNGNNMLTYSSSELRTNSSFLDCTFQMNGRDVHYPFCLKVSYFP